jgi:hypothetical protein
MLWVNTVKDQSTNQKRLNQILDELEISGNYMQMQ